MKNTVLKSIFATLALGAMIGSCGEQRKEAKKETVMEKPYSEPYRPQFHFSPPSGWMNDPNGLVYNNGTYHLFYQFYPDDIVWGPMHWGHAESEDLLHWSNKPFALAPDEKGYIFSGSAVVDSANTSGFGDGKTAPLVAVFTYHDPEGEKAGRKDYQYQGMAYSLDNGQTWEKYAHNPVVPNAGFKDFRDPKVFWNQQVGAWTMALVAGDHLQLWSSPDLKHWEKKSVFGKDRGDHGGVWECPDLFPLKVPGTDIEKWVLFISINPGAPNGGSGTQYFIGDFDGTTFTTDQQDVKWVDHGTDDYAGVTYNNAPDGRRIFIGWMSNWSYAQQVPTQKWRSAMTLPRELSLMPEGDGYVLASYPIAGFDELVSLQKKDSTQLASTQTYTLQGDDLNAAEIRFTTAARNFDMTFSNTDGEELTLRMDGNQGLFTLDRSSSGETDFEPRFAKPQTMPIAGLAQGEIEYRLIMDRASLELFINQGERTLTALAFPKKPYTQFRLSNLEKDSIQLQNIQLSKVASTWE